MKTIIADFGDSFKIFHIGKTLLKGGRVWPGTKAWKPVGDGRTTCIYCGKLLTDELSFARGVGPECIKKYGPWEERAWIETYTKAYKKYVRKTEKNNQQVMKMLAWMESEKIEIPA
jgi:hypothetical protein